ncbi:hypothetical protein FE257_005306 [Aspergillus nanangensis]|uniref:Zn(2)-C6 fungal-type domain-containing protein n=1 Tax=Aspergillus nanangensis TaxID=2582783 RepID=A0AAD4CAL4_ASPNN|nr:hypothetical protein FE257_005306 [Aspergillus nanangensis]
MLKPPSGEQQSPSRTKTKSGCLTCKRIKCDEAKPHCLKCTSTGRKCDGYGSLAILQYTGSSVRLPLQLPPILRISGTERENRSFQFFYERTVPSLAGYCGSEFWNRLVLQVSQHEKSVWHALIALGSLHENFENDQQITGFWFTRQGQDKFAVQEYVTAIRALLGPSQIPTRDALQTSSLTVDVCLISCILFVCFEILSSHYDSAIGHVRSGIRIYSEIYYDPSSGTYRHPFFKPSTVTTLEMESLWRILNRLQTQALTLTRDDTDKFLSGSRPVRDFGLTKIPQSFRSVEEARDILEYYRWQFYREFHALGGMMDVTNPVKVSDEALVLLRIYEPFLEQWSIALNNFEQGRGTSLTARDKIGLSILKMHQCMHIIQLENGKFGDTAPSAWDRYNSLFEQVVVLGASVVDSMHGIQCLSLSTSQLNNLSKAGCLKPSFSLEAGIIAPLYDTATLCRDPVIRRKAVNVLRSASRQEGVFSSHVCAVFAEQVILIEETVAAGGTMDVEKDVSLLTLISEARYNQGEIKGSSEVPDAARLIYAYPTVNIMDKKVSFIIGQDQGMHIEIPLPAMKAMLDAEI